MLEDAPCVQIEEELQAGTASPLGARFSVTLYSRVGPDAVEVRGPQRVPIEDAISWGRSRAGQVLVLISDQSGGGAWFSAGEQTPASWEVGRLLPWPREGGLDAARRFAARAGTGFADRADATWFVQLSVTGDIAAPGGFGDHWAQALESDPAVVELLGVGHVATPHVPAEILDRLTADAQNFWARVYEPSIARAYVVITASSEHEAEFIGHDVASRQAGRLLRELGALDLRRCVSFHADCELFGSYAGA